jgi:hypothetical protein
MASSNFGAMPSETAGLLPEAFAGTRGCVPAHTVGMSDGMLISGWHASRLLN